MEAEMCISKIKMQVSDIELAHQKHSQLFSQAKISCYSAAKKPKLQEPYSYAKLAGAGVGLNQFPFSKSGN